MPSNAVEYITEVSNDPTAIGIDQLLTAEAIDSKMPAGATVVTFTNADLISGWFLYSYESGQPVIFWSMVDENDESILVPASMDDAGTFIQFDFRSLEDPLNPGVFITGTWAVTIWTSEGPVGVAPAPVPPGENNTGRLRIEPPIGEIDLKVVNGHTLYTVPSGFLFSPEELQVVLVEADGVGSEASFSLSVVAGDTIISSQTLPIDELYERHTVDISSSDVLPAGSVLNFAVTGGGSASGNMTARVYLFGYLDEV